jgi:hypothetical protein
MSLLIVPLPSPDLAALRFSFKGAGADDARVSFGREARAGSLPSSTYFAASTGPPMVASHAK